MLQGEQETDMPRKSLAIILGIRPDVIRSSIILRILRSQRDCDVHFIWSGQHYSDNLKDIFFRELQVKPPDIELNVSGETDTEVVSSLVKRLFPVLKKLRPVAAIFLGDTNTVMGCISAANLNIPIVHIEGCMRSYDWRMPEEKYRTVVDHLSDVIYAYLDEYRLQGIAEGLNPKNIVVTGNPIVDVLNEQYFAKKSLFEKLADIDFFTSRGIEKGEYYLMTCHRRENVCDPILLKNILELAGAAGRTVYFPASYRTQDALRTDLLKLPRNMIKVDPIGYREFLALMTNSRGVISDSGTVVEEACILQVPAIQIRTSTERPQVYDVRACVKFDPSDPRKYGHNTVFAKLEALHGKTWPNPFGDGKASERIAYDILQRTKEDGFTRHRPSDYELDVRRAYRDDGL